MNKPREILFALLLGLTLGTSVGVAAAFTVTQNTERPRTYIGETLVVAPRNSSDADEKPSAQRAVGPSLTGAYSSAATPNEGLPVRRNLTSQTVPGPRNATFPNAQASATAVQVSRQLPATLIVTAVTCGDVNLDGSVNIIDTVGILQIVVGRVQPSSVQAVLSNLDGNESVDVPDAIISLRHLVGLNPPPSDCAPPVAG